MLSLSGETSGQMRGNQGVCTELMVFALRLRKTLRENLGDILKAVRSVESSNRGGLDYF